MGRAATLDLRFSASIEPFFDRLDTFPNVIYLKNTLVLLFQPHTHFLGAELNPYRKCNRNRYRSSFTAQVADCSELPKPVPEYKNQCPTDARHAGPMPDPMHPRGVVSDRKTSIGQCRGREGRPRVAPSVSDPVKYQSRV